MNSEYDLTTPEGLESARFVSSRGDNWVIYGEPTAQATLKNSMPFVVGNGISTLINKGKDLFSSKKVVENQTQAASDLIKAGKDNGVKKMKITLDQEAGLNFEAPIREGVNIRAMAGSKGKMTIEVEYS